MIHPSDIEQLIEGNELAFRKAYNAYSDRVYRLAIRFLKDEGWSEEIVQETFLKLWLNRHVLDTAGNIWLYLYVIAKRLCLNRLREIRKSTEHIEILMKHMADENSFSEEGLEVKEMEKLLQDAIMKLPQQQQLVFQLSRSEGLSHKEIAERLMVSPNTVKNHMVQALKNLKAAMQDAGYVSILLLLFYLTLVD